MLLLLLTHGIHWHFHCGGRSGGGRRGRFAHLHLEAALVVGQQLLAAMVPDDVRRWLQGAAYHAAQYHQAARFHVAIRIADQLGFGYYMCGVVDACACDGEAEQMKFKLIWAHIRACVFWACFVERKEWCVVYKAKLDHSVNVFYS